jgi:DNA-binding CsgD family transcriptional regulator
MIPRDPVLAIIHVMAADKASIDELRRLAPDLAPSISKLTVPAYILDRTGTVRWINDAGIAHFGDLRGREIGQIVDREFATLARQEFAAKVLGTVEATEASVVVRTADGRRVSVDISSAQLVQHGAIVGVFGLADPTDEPPPSAEAANLTPRQMTVLRQLAAGKSTGDIAESLGISTETVRNHVRGITARLGVHSRLEAVIRAHELGVV